MKNSDVILIVDDIQSNVEMLGGVLKDEYQIKVAQNGVRALELSLLHPVPDLILLDIEMPEMDGFEVLSRLKTNSATKDIPVIFISSYSSTEEEERGLIKGAVDYITKPIRPLIVKARVRTHLIIKHQRDALLHMASHDQLTGLCNRYHLVQEGNRIFSRAKRQKEDFCAVIVDIDHFKNVNDTYGHLVGNEILKSIASLLDKYKRVEDLTARYGGEEFVILFDNCSIDDASFKADILRQRVQNLLPMNIKTTASFGIVQLNEKHNTFEQLLKDADKALYMAKEGGRNRVVRYAANY